MARMISILASAVALMLVNGCVGDVADESQEGDEETPAVEVDAPGLEPQYGSTYESNCYCQFCSRYCTVNGVTTKSATPCCS